MKLLNDISTRILNGIGEGIYITDTNRVITFWNKAAEDLTGYKAEEVIGKSCSDQILNHVNEKGENLCFTYCPLLEALKDSVVHEESVFLHHKKGYRIPVNVKTFSIKNNEGQIIGAVETFSDSSEFQSVLKQIDSLQEEVYFDALTKVGSRRFSDLEMASKFDESKRYGWRFAAALCDIDDFKRVNDQFGHAVGDEVLKMVASTMSETLRSVDFIGRWGGEEFILLLPQINSDREILTILDRTRNLIKESFIIRDGKEISVTASFGASLAESDDTPDSLFKRIDRLLYRSKRDGKNRVSI